jgi:hypothetical protein
LQWFVTLSANDESGLILKDCNKKTAIKSADYSALGVIF